LQKDVGLVALRGFAQENRKAAGATQLIELLQLKGWVVTTADALHCHRGVAKAKEIVERGRRLRPGREGEPACLVGRCQGRNPA